MDNTDLRHHCYAMGYSDGEVGAFYDGYEKGRAGAIEEYRLALRKKYADNKYLYPNNGLEYWNLDMEEVDEIAEQLKEQK